MPPKHSESKATQESSKASKGAKKQAEETSKPCSTRAGAKAAKEQANHLPQLRTLLLIKQVTNQEEDVVPNAQQEIAQSSDEDPLLISDSQNMRNKPSSVANIVKPKAPIQAPTTGIEPASTGSLTLCKGTYICTSHAI
ncbi:hypothetical protein ONZ45_g8758 [Pleurotus djamor]|nr:hypothetical protein ONZ45_g8758 [Pleurotus djamor]